LRIALDATPLTVPRTGIGEYTAQLARHLAESFPQDEFLLLSNFPFPPVAGPENLRSLVCRTNWLTGRWWLLGLPAVLEREGVEVFHGTNYAVPFLPPVASVVTVHDLSPRRLAHLHERRTRRTASRLPHMVRAAGHVVALSEAMRHEILEEFRLPPTKVTAIPLASAPQFRAGPADPVTLKKYGVREPYVLFVGTIEPRKNLLTLVRAFAALSPARRRETQLVLCGRRGWGVDALEPEITRLGLTGNAVFTGHVAEEDLPSLYRGAELFAYPSLYEGFGLPPLEAMASGVPVVASAARAHLEVLGEAGVTLPAEDVGAWTQMLETLLGNASLRQQLTQKGLARAAEFSWTTTAERTYGLYRKVLAERSPQRWQQMWRALLDCVTVGRQP
jgi:glycosyltransferase involved in cell wall biosynthesis